MTTSDINLPDENQPNASRIYDYTLGGTLNREVDRQAAEFMFSLLPSTPKWVVMLREFLQKVARDMYAEGFDQFLDLGSGLPTQDHIHHVLPAAKVVYVDNDPVAVRYGKELLKDTPNAVFLEGNIGEVHSILNSPAVREHIDLSRKVAIGINGLAVFFKPDDLRALAQALYDWAPEGSQMYSTYETKDKDKTTPAWEQYLGMFAATGSPMYLVSLEENTEMMKPWRTLSVEPLADYLGKPEGYITEADREGIDVEFYATRLAK